MKDYFGNIIEILLRVGKVYIVETGCGLDNILKITYLKAFHKIINMLVLLFY